MIGKVLAEIVGRNSNACRDLRRIAARIPPQDRRCVTTGRVARYALPAESNAPYEA